MTKAYPTMNWEKVDEGVWLAESGDPGPTVGIIGGVHGHETTGAAVVKSVVDGKVPLEITAGRLLLMHGNPEAIKRQVYYVNDNLNRQFIAPSEDHEPKSDSYEGRRAQVLMPYFDDCEALLDLHEFNKRTPAAEAFIICEPNAFDTARAIGAPVISYGWSTAEAGGTDAYMYESGKEGLCYELGCIEGGRTQAATNRKRGFRVIDRFLAAQGLAEGSPKPLFEEPRFIEALYHVIRTREDYKLHETEAEKFSSFQPLRAGQLIATHGEEQYVANEGEVIIFPYADPDIGNEAFVIGAIRNIPAAA